VKQGDIVTLTAQTKPTGADLGKLEWALDGEPIPNSKGKATIAFEASEAGAREVSATIGAYTAHAAIYVYGAEPFAAALIDKKAVVNLAAVHGALVAIDVKGMSLAEKDEAGHYKHSVTLSGAGAELYEAAPYNDKTISITAKDKNAATVKAAKKLTVAIDGVAAAGLLDLSATTKYPKITVVATPLDAYNPNANASRLTAISSDGSPCRIEGVSVTTAELAAWTPEQGAITLNPGVTKGKVAAQVTVSSEAYKALKKNSPTAEVKVTLQIASSAPKFTQNPRAGKLLTKGQIAVTNPESAIYVQTSTSDGTLQAVTLYEGEAESERFVPEIQDDHSFKIMAVPGAEIAPGAKYPLVVELETDTAESVKANMAIKPTQGSVRAYKSKGAVTLHTSTPAAGADISFALAASANAELAAVRISQKSLAALKWADEKSLELVRNGTDTWSIRFQDGAAPTVLANGKKLKPSYNIKLELWPAGTLGADGKPLGKAKPVTVTVKVNIQ
ncbi:MAG: hypothetical protein LBI54_04415, partial [Lachnospiraceae bacterium]|nr:hypothetical protein [Lachnospiraceae bacterium]